MIFTSSREIYLIINFYLSRIKPFLTKFFKIGINSLLESIRQLKTRVLFEEIEKNRESLLKICEDYDHISA
jgi:hypothetical protein